MVAKGLDFPNVSLVGVLGIDQMLFAQSYRAFERVFSLVTQVVGRSGRADAEGRALIQTVDPQNRILQLAAGQNYTEFYIEEIAARTRHLRGNFFSGKRKRNRPGSPGICKQPAQLRGSA